MSQLYEVVSVEAVAKSTVLYTLKSSRHNQGGVMEFLPGQYAIANFRREGEHDAPAYYSIISSPTDPSTLRFLVRIHGADASVVNQYARKGDTVTVDGPYGEFIYESERDQAAVFIAEESSIAPFMSMIEYALRTKSDNEIILFYSCRTQDTIAFMRELIAIEQLNPHFHVIFAVGEGPTDRLAGRYVVEGGLTIGIIGHVIQNAFSSYSFFAAGSDGFLQQFHSQLVQAGARQDRLFYESFEQSPAQAGTPRQKSRRGILGKLRPTKVSLRTRLATAAALCLLIGFGFIFLRHPSSMPEQAAAVNAGAVLSQSDTAQTSQTSFKQAGYAPALSLMADKTVISNGEKIELAWQATGNLPRCTASGGWQGAVASSGKQQLAPATTTTYTITCDNSSGTQTKSVTVTVKQGAPDLTFNITPSSTTPGMPITLSWSAAATGSTCTASAGWNGTKPASGTSVEKPAASTTYTLTCVSPSGTQTKSVAVAVTTPQPSTAIPTPAAVPAPSKQQPTNAGITAPTVELSAKSTSIPRGTTAQFTWSSGGTSPSCKGTDGLKFRSSLPSNGSVDVVVFETGTYSVTCSNAASSQTKSITINVY